MMKNLLFISEHYLPKNSSPARRIAGFAKYLRDFGWNVIVLTSEKPDAFDAESPVQNMPEDVLVYRIKSPEKLPSLGTRGQCIRISTRLQNRWLTNAWVNEALELCKTILAEHRIDAIMSSFPAPDSHQISYAISKKHQTPWIADFRDIIEELPEDQKLMRLVADLYERRLMRRASGIITVSQVLADILSLRHKAPVHVVPNGFDPDDLSDLKSSDLKEFKICYTGFILRGQREGQELFSALELLAKNENTLFQNIRVEMYVPNQAGRELLQEILGNYPDARTCISIYDGVSAENVRRVQRDAAVLFQISHSHMKGIMTGKIFEYLAARRPILAAPEDHDCVDDLMRKTRAGVTLTDPEAIADQLAAWVREWQQTGRLEYKPDEKAVLSYSRRESARKLANLLNDLAE